MLFFSDCTGAFTSVAVVSSYSTTTPKLQVSLRHESETESGCKSTPRSTSFHLRVPPLPNNDDGDDNDNDGDGYGDNGNHGRRREEINLNNPYLRRKGIDNDYTHLSFQYDYNELVVRSPSHSSSHSPNPNHTPSNNPVVSEGGGSESENESEDQEGRELRKTTIVLLIQPIGVGIGRWYYDRLLSEIPPLIETVENDAGPGPERELIFLAPDLLGCGTACNPSVITLDTKEASNDSGVDHDHDHDHDTIHLKKLPLLRVDDWADQLVDLMVKYELELKGKRNSNDGRQQRVEEYNWCIVSNGGCVPIALEIGQRYAKGQLQLQLQLQSSSKFGADLDSLSPLTNLILSATPSVDSLFSEQDVDKIQKSYKTLSGLPGSLFWWYALRRNGKFIQKFSEKNLASRAENLGEEWTPKCVSQITSFRGNLKDYFSKHTFKA